MWLAVAPDLNGAGSFLMGLAAVLGIVTARLGAKVVKEKRNGETLQQSLTDEQSMRREAEDRASHLALQLRQCRDENNGLRKRIRFGESRSRRSS